MAGGRTGHQLGRMISLSLAVHNIPEGMAVGAVLVSRKVNKIRAGNDCPRMLTTNYLTGAACFSLVLSSLGHFHESAAAHHGYSCLFVCGESALWFAVRIGVCRWSYGLCCLVRIALRSRWADVDDCHLILVPLLVRRNVGYAGSSQSHLVMTSFEKAGGNNYVVSNKHRHHLHQHVSCDADCGRLRRDLWTILIFVAVVVRCLWLIIVRVKWLWLWLWCSVISPHCRMRLLFSFSDSLTSHPILLSAKLFIGYSIGTFIANFGCQVTFSVLLFGEAIISLRSSHLINSTKIWKGEAKKIELTWVSNKKSLLRGMIFLLM